MSKKRTHTEYITTKEEKQKKYLRLSNTFVLFALLFCDKYFRWEIPDVLYVIIAGQSIGIDLTQLAPRKFRR